MTAPVKQKPALHNETSDSPALHKPLSVILDEIEERANRATAGPLTVGEQCCCQRLLNDERDKHYPIFWSDCGNGAHVFRKDDAEFFASARTDVPALVKALRRAIEAIRIMGDNETVMIRSDISPRIELEQITAILNQKQQDV